ncbi:MAG: hypothetical protein U0798_14365 [Gemmataceae bacterium]
MTSLAVSNPLFADLALRGWFPLWLAVLLGLASLAGVVALYLKESGRLPLWRRLILAAIRVSILGSLLFLATRPTIVRQRVDDRARPIVLMVDESQSMQAKDPRNNISERWRVGIAFDKLPLDKPIPTAD